MVLPAETGCVLCPDLQSWALDHGLVSVPSVPSSDSHGHFTVLQRMTAVGDKWGNCRGLPGPAQEQAGFGGEEENLDGLGGSLERRAS